jgi:hypothetical protein
MIIIPPLGSVSDKLLVRGWLGFVSSVAVVNKYKHVTNAVVATIIARMRVSTFMAA